MPGIDVRDSWWVNGRQRSVTALKFVEAEFPASEVKAGRGATVVLQIAITATGSVADVTVTGTAGPAFDAPAFLLGGA